jgi:hypothetical protein
MSLVPIAPGNNPVFTLTPSPAGIPTSVENIGWAVECSDGSAVTMTSVPRDKTGMSATLMIPSSSTVGSVVTFWCVYRRPSDQVEITGGPWSYTLT